MYRPFAIIVLMLSACTHSAYLSDDHYDDVVNLDANFEQLEQKDRQMQQELDEIRTAIEERKQGDKK